jgi:hypothetical protein
MWPGSSTPGAREATAFGCPGPAGMQRAARLPQGDPNRVPFGPRPRSAPRGGRRPRRLVPTPTETSMPRLRRYCIRWPKIMPWSMAISGSRWRRSSLSTASTDAGLPSPMMLPMTWSCESPPRISTPWTTSRLSCRPPPSPAREHPVNEYRPSWDPPGAWAVTVAEGERWSPAPRGRQRAAVSVRSSYTVSVSQLAIRWEKP